jgi:hypothetical protein
MLLPKELKDLVLTYLHPPIFYKLGSNTKDSDDKDIIWAGNHTYGYSTFRGIRLFFKPNSALVINSRCYEDIDNSEIKMATNEIEQALITDYIKAFNGTTDNNYTIADYHNLRQESIDKFLAQFNHIKSKSTKVDNYVSYISLEQVQKDDHFDGGKFFHLMQNLKIYHPRVYNKIVLSNMFRQHSVDGYIMWAYNELTFFFELDAIIKELEQVNAYTKANGVVFVWV